MTITGFWLDKSVQGVEDLITQLVAAPAVQFSEGDACVIDTSTGSGTAGLLIQAPAQTTSPRYIVLSVTAALALQTQGGFPSGPLRQATYDLSLTSAQGGSPVMVIDAGIEPDIIMATQFAAATFDGTAANANTTLNNIVFTGAGATNDFNGGQVYVNETGQQFTIVTDTVAAGAHTFTIFPTPAVAVTTGNTIRAVPWGPGYVGGVKLEAATPWQGISVAVADKTGGHLLIHNVDLAKRTAYVRFSGSGIIGV